MRSRTLLRLLAGCLVVFGLLWGTTTAALYAFMRQPPEVFGAVMAHVPGVAMALFPFERLWVSARRGRLEVGDPAPDFALPILHGSRVVRLAEEYRQKPVVLVFGSYT